jgi:predicted negative regulator of RcsB-dependent stress response
VRDVARLRLARVLISQNKAGDALKLLEEPLPASFGGLVEEARGDAYAALGKTEEARSAYDRALAQTQDDAEFLKLKRADLGIVHPAP